MRRRKIAVLAAASVSGLGLSAGAFGQIATGAFLPTGPLTNAFLSVDINSGPGNGSNGGTVTSGTNGWNENTSSGAFSPDNFGVVWTPWFGPTYSGGDGTAAPSATAVTSISKLFNYSGPPPANYGPGGADGPVVNYGGGTYSGNFSGTPGNFGPIAPITVTISEAGTLSNYVSTGLNSRDRGNPTGAYGLNDNDMFRDLIFSSGSGSNVQGTNYLQVEFAGLTPGAQYEIAGYSYDYSSGHSEAWTATAPYASGGYTNIGGFLAPADEQVIAWATDGATPAPAVFTVTANGSGDAFLWTWGGSGNTGDSSATASYIDGLQIAAVPEPASVGLLAMTGLGIMARRRSRA